MPALRRKGQLSTEIMKRNRHNPFACHNSTKSLKQSSSLLKSNKQAKELEPVLQSQCDGEFERISTISGDRGPSVELQNLTSTSSDALLVGTVDSLEDTSSSSFETIFSPNFEYGDLQLLLKEQNDVVNHPTLELPNLVADESDDGICSQSEDQTCSVLDFYTCEDLSTLPFDSKMEFNNDLNFDYPFSELTYSDFMIDTREQYFILPFLERTGENSAVDEGNLPPETFASSDDTCFYLEMHQDSEPSYLSSFPGEMDYINPQVVFGVPPDLPSAVSPLCPVLDTQPRKHVTLVLDLDETLVHSTLESCDDADFTFQVYFSMKENTVYVRRRPFLQMFLERVAQMFEIFIFTASQNIYASQLLDKLDPEHKIISKRIYRESCTFSDGSYTKDLRILGIDLAKVAIIDNSPQVFQLQINNGIPIKSWFDDPTDHALVQLLPFLESLVDADDVRPLIAKKFSNVQI